jgi:hypothetical protein
MAVRWWRGLFLAAFSICGGRAGGRKWLQAREMEAGDRGDEMGNRKRRGVMCRRKMTRLPLESVVLGNTAAAPVFSVFTPTLQLREVAVRGTTVISACRMESNWTEGTVRRVYSAWGQNGKRKVGK